jgi:class 3 adenylate cyclase
MAARILVVDDEEDLEILVKQKFRQKIREQQYEFHFAQNGLAALQKLNEIDGIDLVLSDINMPEMDGLTLLSKIRESRPLLKSVIISAYGDMENIRTAMNRGAYDFITKPINFDDLGLTVEKTMEEVKRTKETIRAIRENDILKMYVDTSVLQFMNERETGSSLFSNQMIEASVIFIDICGFTGISERESPDVVVDLLNKYFDVMVQGIISQNGNVDKFIGDCVMAVFQGEYHLDRAIDAALKIRSDIEALPVEFSFKPGVAIGINSGEMISGNIGSATLKCLDYTVIGDVVNTAQRLQSVAGNGQIVISESAWEKVKDSFNCRLLGPRTLKNKTSEVMVYEVLN